MAVKFGIIACSGIARRRFLPALRSSSVAQLERIGSRQSANAQKLGEKFRCGKYGSYESVLEDKEVDAVYVSTPVTLHQEWVEKAACHRKHIICEKPAFTTYEAAVKVVELCEEKGVRVAENYSFLHHPQHALVQSLIDSGRVGLPRLVRSEFTYPRPSGDDIRLQPELKGGVFFDAAGYPVAAALWLVSSRPETVFCHINHESTGELDCDVTITIQFSGGEIAQLFSGFGLHYRSNYSVLGSMGRIKVERAFSVKPDFSATVILETRAGPERFTVKPSDQFQIMIEDFAREINTATETRGQFERDLLQRHAVMDAAWRSYHEQRLVSMSEYPL